MNGLGNGVIYPSPTYNSSGTNTNDPFDIYSPSDLAFWITDLAFVYADEDGTTPSADANSSPASNLSTNDLVSKWNNPATTNIPNSPWSGIELLQSTTARKPNWIQRTGKTAGRFGRINFLPSGGAPDYLTFSSNQGGSGVKSHIEIESGQDFTLIIRANWFETNSNAILGSSDGEQVLRVHDSDRVDLVTDWSGGHVISWEDATNGPIETATGDNKYNFIALKRNAQGYLTLYILNDGTLYDWDKAEQAQYTGALDFTVLGAKDPSREGHKGYITDIVLYLQNLTETEMSNVMGYIETQQT